MNERSNLISIGLPTFNRASTLVRAVDSLLAQTYKNFELIISDNASSDDTEKICLDYAKKDSRVKYFRQSHNIGLIANSNFVVSKAEGEYFMFASDDDWWHPDFVLKLRDALDKNQECGIAMSSLRQVHEDGSLANEVRYEGSNDVSKFSRNRTFNEVIFKNPPTHFFIMGLYRTEILKKLFWENSPKVLGPDKIIMYEASLFTRFCSVPDILWVRTSSFVPDAKRYTGDYQKIFTNDYANAKHVVKAISRLFKSPNISLVEKAKILPLRAPALIWGFRKHLLRELFPWVYKIFKQIR
ncbi:MAG: glycosyltransferase family 2 protein [bacterium]|nr:glycosyltransferase family 2 protein [bacterium]